MYILVCIHTFDEHFGKMDFSPTSLVLFIAIIVTGECQSEKCTGLIQGMWVHFPSTWDNKTFVWISNCKFITYTSAYNDLLKSKIRYIACVYKTVFHDISAYVVTNTIIRNQMCACWIFSLKRNSTDKKRLFWHILKVSAEYY